MCPYLLSSIACASADGPQVFLLPLVSDLVHLSVIVTYGLIYNKMQEVLVPLLRPEET